MSVQKSNTTGWTCDGSSLMMKLTCAGFPGGGLSTGIFLVFLSSSPTVSISSSRWSGLPTSLLASRLKVVLVFPWNINRAKDLARCSFPPEEWELGMWCWIALPSRPTHSSHPQTRTSIFFSKQAMCSFVLEFLKDLCRSSIGKTDAAFMAIDSKAQCWR